MKGFAAVDLFCGAGGMTHGFLQGGMRVVAGVDIDPSCRFPLEANNLGTRFVEQSIETLTAGELAGLYPRGVVRVLVGCAPCQPFSKYALRDGPDERWLLLYEF
ncbi:MAG: DNA cytosine methyltransferase, partial [Actinomycetota bacterium]|nr:DNA cytosine methyltransferase [Actinomycetota bacterium]